MCNTVRQESLLNQCNQPRRYTTLSSATGGEWRGVVWDEEEEDPPISLVCEHGCLDQVKNLWEIAIIEPTTVMRGSGDARCQFSHLRPG